MLIYITFIYFRLLYIIIIGTVPVPIIIIIIIEKVLEMRSQTEGLEKYLIIKINKNR